MVIDAGGSDLAVVSTHLQPPPGGGPVTQAREVARSPGSSPATARWSSAGTSTPSRATRRSRSCSTARVWWTVSPPSRPLPTSPADAPDEQIDHLLVSPDIQVTDVAAPRTTASDHLPVAATLTVV